MGIGRGMKWNGLHIFNFLHLLFSILRTVISKNIIVYIIMSEQISLKKFDAKNIDHHSKIAIIGAPGTGKSTLITDLLYHTKEKLPMHVIMSSTEECNNHYSNMFPHIRIYDKCDHEVVNELVERQKKALCNKIPNPECCLVLDDCVDSNTMKYKSIKEIIKNGKYYKLFYIMAMQYCMDIPPELRVCLDYIFILKDSFQINRKRLFESFGGIFPSFEIFSQILDSCTNNYTCLVIKNRGISNKLEDTCYWYKADLHDEFKMDEVNESINIKLLDEKFA